MSQHQNADAHALPQASVTLQIPFHDVDAMQVVWHGHYPKYFEYARSKLLDAIDYNYPQMQASGYLWPVIGMTVKYIKPLQLLQTIRVSAQLEEWEFRLRIRYLIRDANSDQKLCSGYTDQVAVDAHTQEMLLASPAILRRKLGVE